MNFNDRLRHNKALTIKNHQINDPIQLSKLIINTNYRILNDIKIQINTQSKNSSSTQFNQLKINLLDKLIVRIESILLSIIPMNLSNADYVEEVSILIVWVDMRKFAKKFSLIKENSLIYNNIESYKKIKRN